MDWNQLKEEAKKMGYVKHYMWGDYGEPVDAISKIDNIGTKIALDENGNMYLHRLTKDQTLSIMKALQ